MIKEDRQRRSHLAYAMAQAPRLVERMSWSEPPDGRDVSHVLRTIDET